MTLVKYSNGRSVRTVSLRIDQWHRLLEVADLTADTEDQLILEMLRYALANGDNDTGDEIQ
jgi:hypothetical protein